MRGTGKLLFTASGENHRFIKRLWIPTILALISNGFTFYNRWSNWQIQTQFYWLWYEVPASPSFANLLIMSILIVLPALATGKAIGEMKIHVYDNGIEGYWFKTWGLLPRLHNFKLRYDEIKTVMERKGTLYIRTTEGRFILVVHNPEIVSRKIVKMMDSTFG